MDMQNLVNGVTGKQDELRARFEQLKAQAQQGQLKGDLLNEFNQLKHRFEPGDDKQQ